MSIESGLKSHLAHTKDISHRMSTELAAVAQTVALSSTERVERSIRSFRRSYSSNMKDVWTQFGDRRSSLARSLLKNQYAFSRIAERRMVAITENTANYMGQRASKLKSAQDEIGRKLNQAAKDATASVTSFAHIDGRHYLPTLDAGSIRKARRRAVSLFNQLEDLPCKVKQMKSSISPRKNACHLRKTSKRHGCRHGSRGRA